MKISVEYEGKFICTDQESVCFGVRGNHRFCKNNTGSFHVPDGITAFSVSVYEALGQVVVCAVKV